jgi:DNA polymerase (family X)
MSNEEIAQRLERVAELLAAQGANRFRVAAYRKAGATLRNLESKATDILETSGIDGLATLPAIGPHLARAIAEIIETKSLGLLERLTGEAPAETLFGTVAGIGPELASRIHEELGIETLEELEAAAHDGRLAEVRGFGPKRLLGVTEALAGRLGNRSRKRSAISREVPPVSELLDVDREYREKAAEGRLRRITPRRFNPEGRDWLPILHTSRGSRHYTALFSNTALAHEYGRTHDWVVLYEDDGSRERQATVVTETRGPLAGRRVVRGRERESELHYRETGRTLPAIPRRSSPPFR